MTLEQVRKEIAKEFPIIQRKASYVTHKLQRTYAKKLKEQDMLFQFDYQSKYYNQWIYQIQLGKKKLLHSFLVYYYGEKGLTSITMLNDNQVLHCTGHFFKRYRERLGLDLVQPNEVMRLFLKENTDHCFTFLGEVKPGIKRIFATLREGTGLGTYHSSLCMYKLNTFVTSDMLRGTQRKWDGNAKTKMSLRQLGLLDKNFNPVKPLVRM